MTLWLEVIQSAVAWIASAVFVLGSIVGYYPQYKEIRKLQNADGFSTLVSLILIVANTVRVFFWMGKDFEVTFLYQAFAVILCQFAMLSLCTRVRVSQQRADKPRRQFSDLKLRDFWNWDDVTSYLQAEGVLVGTLVVASVLLLQYDWFVETLGNVSLGTEAMLAVPQVFRNYVKQSTHGLNDRDGGNVVPPPLFALALVGSLAMILSWFLGDTFKTVYFVASGAPLQFLYCGLFQMFSDMVILYQMFVLYAHEPLDLTHFCKARVRRWVQSWFATAASRAQPARTV